jgi:hypothetical protein
MIYAAIALFERAQLQTASDSAAISASLMWKGEQAASPSLGAGAGAGSGTQVGSGAEAGSGAGVEAGTGAGAGSGASAIFASGGLYRRTVDAKASEKLGAIADASLRYFGAISIPGFTAPGAASGSAGGPLCKTVSVSMDGSTHVPNSAVTGAFGMGSRFGSSGAAKSIVPDFPELIRNADLVVDIEEKLEDASPEFKAFADNFEAAAGKIKSFIGGLF